MSETRPQAAVDPLVLTAPAGGSQRAAAVTIDTAIVVCLAAGGILCLGLRLPAIGWMLVAAAIVAIVATVVAVGATGRSLGGMIAGIRLVERSSAAPSGGRLLGDALSGRLRAFDLRRGRDPLDPALAPFRFPERTAAAPVAAAPRRDVPRPAIVALDSGQKLPLVEALVIGRSPEAPADAPAPVFQWPDLSRTLSKSHARLEWDGRRAWITDLGSTNGTALRAAGADQPLLPHQRTPLPPVAVLALGDRVLTVTAPS